MTTSSLYPPNSQTLSDGVIGNVVQRAGSLRRSVHPETDFNARTTTANSDCYHPMTAEEKLSGRKRLQDAASAAPQLPSKKIRTDTPFTSQPKCNQLIKDVVMERELRLERCRVNQIRHRQKQQRHLTDLEAQVEQLREETQKLEKQRQVTSFGIPTKETVWNIAAEYFRLFRHGYIAPVKLEEASSTNDSAPSKHPHVQLEFLQVTMAINVTDGVVCGVDALLKNWRLFSLYHDDVHLQLERLEKEQEDSVIATVKWGITITEKTLRTVYPHLLFGEWSSLAERLLNQRIAMDGSIRFGWDHSSGRVMSLEGKMDMLTPMLRLQGNLQDVARVFDGALISLDGTLRR